MTTITEQIEWLGKHNHPMLNDIAESLKDLQAYEQKREAKLKHVSPKYVLDCVCAYYATTKYELSEPNRAGMLPEARQVGMYLMKYYCELPAGEIALYFNRDHSIVSKSTSRIRDLISAGDPVKTRVEDIKRLFV